MQPRLTLTEVAVAILTFVLLVAGALPAFMPHRRIATRIKCASNLKQVGLAYRIWDGDNNNFYPMGVLTNKNGRALYTSSSNEFLYFAIMSNELSNPQVLICPEDNKHVGATNFTTDFNSHHLSYFVGLDTTNESNPLSFLGGDSNLTNSLPLYHGILYVTSNRPTGWTVERHKGAGNIAMADGSVQQYSTAGVNNAIVNSRQRNHLLMPPP